MDRDVVIQILEGKVISSDQLNTFIADYVKDEVGKEATGEQLSGIINLLRVGVFNLRFAASKVARKLDLNVINIYDQNNVFIRTYVYDGN